LTSARWRLLFWAAVLFTFVMAVMPHPPRLPGEPNDKIQHIIAFVTLAGLGRLAFGRDATAKLIIGLSLFGALIEVTQSVPALHRDADAVDWLADTAAVLLVLVPLRLLRSP
jgi:VanZ family protein